MLQPDHECIFPVFLVDGQKFLPVKKEFEI